ncbi:MAG: hypothetical protein LBI44_06965 [Oscillospiraceae bacterium]|jgi:sugar fermentation stimulation protein A|nr:hypothetical protein [Oscillospiraceae bacterium]
MTESAYVFNPPLVEGVIQNRKTQYTMSVEAGGEVVACHCPTTGRIGNIELGGRPCLLSKSTDPSRKTPYTVEAVSLNRPEDAAKSWIGINQNAANRYAGITWKTAVLAIWSQRAARCIGRKSSARRNWIFSSGTPTLR